MDVATVRRGAAAVMVGSIFGVLGTGLMHYFSLL